MRILIKKARIIDPSQNLDITGDLLIKYRNKRKYRNHFW